MRVSLIFGCEPLLERWQRFFESHNGALAHCKWTMPGCLMGMYGKMAAVDEAQIVEMASCDCDAMMIHFESDSAVDLDKNWDIVLRLIEALAAPVSIMEEGEPVGEDWSYGPAHYVTPALVSSIASRLAVVDAQVLESTFDTLDDGSVYPLFGFEDPRQREWAMETYGLVVRLFESASSRGQFVIFVVV